MRTIPPEGEDVADGWLGELGIFHEVLEGKARNWGDPANTSLQMWRGRTTTTTNRTMGFLTRSLSRRPRANGTTQLSPFLQLLDASPERPTASRGPPGHQRTTPLPAPGSPPARGSSSSRRRGGGQQDFRQGVLSTLNQANSLEAARQASFRRVAKDCPASGCDDDGQ